ncbi:MAG: FKBP-type peptidyl-prolyl cis-trans isomerase, partial [Bacteroidetes bacterium]|nr:FKBP-type peptidyl-prolyl cis-trans isomerase [Bacteroidota bacterium]
MYTELEKVSYAVGMSIAESLKNQNLEGVDIRVLAEAMNDIFNGNKLKLAPNEANDAIQTYLDSKRNEAFAQVKSEGELFLIANRTKDAIHTTSSGLQYEILNEGSGRKPGPTDTVTVHYHGTLIDGTVFDSSVQRGTPASFGVNQVIRGWTEALQLMPIGSKYKLFIPQ